MRPNMALSAVALRSCSVGSSILLGGSIKSGGGISSRGSAGRNPWSSGDMPSKSPPDALARCQVIGDEQTLTTSSQATSISSAARPRSGSICNDSPVAASLNQAAVTTLVSEPECIAVWVRVLLRRPAHRMDWIKRNKRYTPYKAYFE